MDVVKRNIWFNQLGQLDCCPDAAADRELPHEIVFSLSSKLTANYFLVSGDALALNFIIIWFIGDTFSFLG